MYFRKPFIHLLKHEYQTTSVCVVQFSSFCIRGSGVSFVFFLWLCPFYFLNVKEEMLFQIKARQETREWTWGLNRCRNRCWPTRILLLLYYDLRTWNNVLLLSGGEREVHRVIEIRYRQCPWYRTCNYTSFFPLAALILIRVNANKLNCNRGPGKHSLFFSELCYFTCLLMCYVFIHLSLNKARDDTPKSNLLST